LTDRPQRKSTNLSNSFRDWVGHREKLIRMFVQQQVVVAKMRTAHVPVEIFRFHVEREYIRQDAVHRGSDVLRRRSCEVSSCLQWGVTSVKKFYGLSRIRFFHGFICTS